MDILAILVDLCCELDCNRVSCTTLKTGKKDSKGQEFQFQFMKNSVCMYSVFHEMIAFEVGKQTKGLLAYNFVKLNVVPVHQQQNGSSCGFSSASICLVYMLYPATVQFDIYRMCMSTLVKMFEGWPYGTIRYNALGDWYPTDDPCSKGRPIW